MSKTLRMMAILIVLALGCAVAVSADPIWVSKGVRFPTGVARDTLGALYANTHEGVFKSSDDGETWAGVLTDPEYHGGFVVTVNPVTNSVFAAVEAGVYRSLDGGENWTKMPNSIVGTYSMATRADGLIIVAGSPGFWRSFDNGDNWEKVNNDLGPLHNGITFSKNGTIYVASLLNGLLRSTDDGVTWEDISGNFGAADNVQDVVADTVNDYVYITGYHLFFHDPTYNKVYRSDDDGDTWVQVDSVGGISLSMGIDSQGYVYSGRQPTAYSTDFGATWIDISDGIDQGNRLVEFIEASPGKMVLADMDDSLKVAYFGTEPSFVRGDIAPAGNPDGQVSLGDLTQLVDFLFISLQHPWEPFERGNVDCSADGQVSLGDLTAMVDFLFISLEPFGCQ